MFLAFEKKRANARDIIHTPPPLRDYIYMAGTRSPANIAAIAISAFGISISVIATLCVTAVAIYSYMKIVNDADAVVEAARKCGGGAKPDPIIVKPIDYVSSDPEVFVVATTVPFVQTKSIFDKIVSDLGDGSGAQIASFSNLSSVFSPIAPARSPDWCGTPAFIQNRDGTDYMTVEPVSTSNAQCRTVGLNERTPNPGSSLTAYGIVVYGKKPTQADAPRAVPDSFHILPFNSVSWARPKTTTAAP